MPATPPVPTVRQTAGGRKLGKGNPIAFTLSLDPDIELFENELTPSGFDSDAPIDTTDQHNVTTHTWSPGGLIIDSSVMLKCHFDPVVMNDLRLMANVPQTGTALLPDGSTYAQYGWVKSAKPSVIKRGSVPELDVEFFVSNTDPVTCLEALGTYTAGSGTAASC